jgi:nucleoside-diphosphate-sugar epimerase
LVYIDDVVDAIMCAVERQLVSGEVIQLIDNERLTQEEILALAEPGGAGAVRIPRSAALLAGKLSEYALRRLGRQSPIGTYRLRSALAPASFRSERAERLLGWRPRVGAREGIRRVTADRTV